LCDFALGTDTGGSVRAPANHCGLFGIRPTHGRVSLDGCHALAPSLDTCGFFARDGATFARVAAVVLGEDTATLPANPRLMIAADTFTALAVEVRGALAPAIQRLEGVLGRAEMREVAADGFEPLYWAFRHIQGREAWAVDGPMIERFQPPLGPGVAERFAFSKAVSVHQAAEAAGVRASFRERFAGLIETDGVLILPTMPDVAPLLTDSEEALDGYRNMALNLLSLSGLSGLPQVTIPVASRLGAPLGLSLIGPAGSDLSLVRLAARLADEVE
jgi:amidase